MKVPAFGNLGQSTLARGVTRAEASGGNEPEAHEGKERIAGPRRG